MKIKEKSAKNKKKNLKPKIDNNVSNSKSLSI